MCELHVDDLLAALACDDAEGTPPALLRLTEEIQAAAGRLDVHSFLDAADRGVPVLDVRSPSEYAQGHVPGAASVPLFSDDERARVGTLYHAAGRSAAMELGMRLVRPKLGWLVERAAELLAVARASGESSGAVLVHCWRGGLRSGAVAWLLRQHGIEARTLGGGYKAFRAWATAYWGSVEMPPKHARTRVRGARRPKRDGRKSGGAGGAGGVPALAAASQASQACEGGAAAAGAAAAGAAAGAAAAAAADAAAAAAAGAAMAEVVAAARALPGPRVCVVGGRTGVGKTRVLHALRSRGEAVVDLEGLARHRGSAFGWVGTVEAGGGAQPSSEHFTNLLACEWRRLEARGEAKGGRGRGWVFLEDEDSHIGHVSVPKPVYAALRCAPLVVRVSLPEHARVRLLLDDYVAGHADGPAAGEWLARMEESVRTARRAVRNLGTRPRHVHVR